MLILDLHAFHQWKLLKLHHTSFDQQGNESYYEATSLQSFYLIKIAEMQNKELLNLNDQLFENLFIRFHNQKSNLDLAH
jgi:hypothetical protein